MMPPMIVQRVLPVMKLPGRTLTPCRNQIPPTTSRMMPATLIVNSLRGMVLATPPGDGSKCGGLFRWVYEGINKAGTWEGELEMVGGEGFEPPTSCV